MSNISPFLIVSFDQEELSGLVELARVLGYPDVQVAVGGIAQAIEALNERTTAPEYILIDIGGRNDAALKDIDELALHCEESVRVVVVGTVNDIVFYRELKARGVLEYFPRPVQASELRTVLFNSKALQTTTRESSGLGTVVSVMAAASGDGATTVALNLAYSLATTYNQPTVLVDMDYQFGLISKSLDLNATFGIRELFDYPDRGLDDMLISKMLVKYHDNLDIVAAPNELRLMPMIRPETIRELVGVLRSKFAFIVVDVPHVWTDWTAATLTYSDHSVMVAQLWLRSLTHASRLLSGWHSIGVSDKDISVVINRSGAKFKEAITTQDFEHICRHSITAHINNDIRAVAHAEHEAKTLMETEDGGIIRDQFNQFAGHLCRRYRPDAVEQVKQQGSLKKSLKSLLAK
ncbi:MAG: CpaE family protein [Alphaproteobacteria bacterium]